MKLKIYLLILLFCVFGSVKAQMQSVSLDISQSEINGGNALPAEEAFQIRGEIPSEIGLVTMTIFPSNKSAKAGHMYDWRTTFGYQERAFQLQVSDPLRSNQNYDMVFQFYQKAETDQIREVRELIHQNLEAYVSTITEVRKSGIKLSESQPVIMENLDQIVLQGTRNFALPRGEKFPGFSDIVRQKIDQATGLKLRLAKWNVSENTDDEQERAIYAEQYMKELLQLLYAETDQYLSPNMLTLVDEKSIRNYPTEKTANVIPINIGYGAISLGNDVANDQFVQGTFAGLSFPLGNKVFTKFLGNMSPSTGVFLSGNLENSQGDRISGPWVDRPIYVGLGYNFLRILRLNAGGAFLTTTPDGGSSRDSFQPYVGLSLEMNVWFGFGKKK